MLETILDDKKTMEKLNFISETVILKPGDYLTPYDLVLSSMGGGGQSFQVKVLSVKAKNEKNKKQLDRIKDKILPMTSRDHYVRLCERHKNALISNQTQENLQAKFIKNILNPRLHELENEMHETFPIYDEKDIRKLIKCFKIKDVNPNIFQIFATKCHEKPLTGEDLQNFEYKQTMASLPDHHKVPKAIEEIDTPKFLGFKVPYKSGRTLKAILNPKMIEKLIPEERQIRNMDQIYLPAKETLAILSQVTSTCSNLLEQGILYVDVQLANLLADYNGNINILDLDEAVNLNDGEIRFKKASGDQHYLAPERIERISYNQEGKTKYRMTDEIFVDEQGLTYSLGELAYYLMTNNHSHDGERFDSVKRQVIENRIRNPLRYHNKKGFSPFKSYPYTQEQVQELVMKPLKKIPDYYKHAEEFARITALIPEDYKKYEELKVKLVRPAVKDLARKCNMLFEEISPNQSPEEVVRDMMRRDKDEVYSAFKINQKQETKEEEIEFE